MRDQSDQLALITRILLLVGLAWLVRLTKPLFTIFSQAISGRDLILLLGGLFLLGKATHEIHDRLEGEDGAPRDIVVINTAAALVATGVSGDFRDAAGVARSTIDCGAASKKLARLKIFTNADSR